MSIGPSNRTVGRVAKLGVISSTRANTAWRRPDAADLSPSSNIAVRISVIVVSRFSTACSIFEAISVESPRREAPSRLIPTAYIRWMTLS